MKTSVKMLPSRKPNKSTVVRLADTKSSQRVVTRALREAVRSQPFIRVVNGFLRGQGEIDHIVVGPVGIYVVETRDYRGSVVFERGSLTVDGSPVQGDPLGRVCRAASLVRQLMRLAGVSIRRVQPVLCTPFADLDRPEYIDGVLLTRSEHLGFLIRHWQGHPLRNEEAVRAFHVLRTRVERVAA